MKIMFPAWHVSSIVCRAFHDRGTGRGVGASRAGHGACGNSRRRRGMVETFNTGKACNLACCRLGCKSWSCIVRRLVISQSTRCWPAGIACVSTRMPRSPPPVEFGIRFTTVMREDGAGGAGHKAGCARVLRCRARRHSGQVDGLISGRLRRRRHIGTHAGRHRQAAGRRPATVVERGSREREGRGLHAWGEPWADLSGREGGRGG